MRSVRNICAVKANSDLVIRAKIDVDAQANIA